MPAGESGRWLGVDAVKKTTLTLMLVVVGLLSAAALAAVPAIHRPDGRASGKGCDPRSLRSAVTRTTVARLRALRLPRGSASRARPKVYRVDVELVGVTVKGSAVELIVAGRGKRTNTIVAGFPYGGCKRGTPLAKRMRKARAALAAACGRARNQAVGLEGEALITGVASARRGAKGNAIQLLPVLDFRATRCARVTAATQAPPGPPASVAAASLPTPPAPPPEPPPEPEPRSDCTVTLSQGALEAEANRAADRVICLETAYYQEPGDALIEITKPDVHLKAAAGAHPIVCGRFALRGDGDSVGADVNIDPTCAPYFNEHSPWNTVASEYPPSVPVPATWLKDFDGVDGTTPLTLTRTWEHGKAIFKATPADPVTATYRIADASQCFGAANGCAAWQPHDPSHIVHDETSPVPDRLPIPAGVRCPALPLVDNGHDRALTVISADGKTAWDFWHCTHAATPQEPWYTAAVATKWSLDPDDPESLGYQNGASNSARASGTPLLPTTVTPREAVSGIHHALGLTVVNVANGYLNPPASHTDGCADNCSHLRYGMLFVLDPAFKPAVKYPTIGEQNVIAALKRYGAYLVDQSTVFELDGSPNEPTAPAVSDALWNAANATLPRLGIKPSDLRYVPTPGSPPAL